MAGSQVSVPSSPSFDYFGDDQEDKYNYFGTVKAGGTAVEW